MTPLPNQENCSMEFIVNDGAPRLSDVTEKLRSLRAKEQHLRGIARAWLRGRERMISGFRNP